jgi:hypothetical protein
VRTPTRTVPGTGLSYLPYALLVAFSVALFLFWDGPLWTAKREVSHVGRFAWSYLLVIPAAAALLAAARRLSLSHLIAATCSAWGVKLVITSALYFALARGTAHVPVAPAGPVSSKKMAVAGTDYRPAGAGFKGGAVRGGVVLGDVPVGGAVVLVDRPAPGLPLPAEPAPFRLTIDGSRYRGQVYLGQKDASFEVESKDSVLHTLHVYEGERAVMNMPVPAGGKAHAFQAPEPGVYELRCDTHGSERAALVVVDHPYVARTDEAGQLTLADVPAGPITLVVVAPALGGKKSFVRRIPARVEVSETTVVHMDLSTPEVAEERL